MAVLLITYDLNKPGQNYDDFMRLSRITHGQDCQSLPMQLKQLEPQDKSTVS